jgi:hypothetical protein
VALFEVNAKEPAGSLWPVATMGRGHGDDSIYFDQASGCWVASMCPGYSPDGTRKRRTVRGRTKTEVRDKLRLLREDISASVRAPAGYAVSRGWLRNGAGTCESSFC